MSLTPTADKVIAKAKSQIGYHEGKKGSTWTNIQKFSPAVPGLEWSQGQAWCATFVSWVFYVLGLRSLTLLTASTDALSKWFQDHKRWSEYPAIGAIGFLAHNGDEYHTFIVTKYDGTYIWTVEGNTNTNGSSQGDGVYQLKRRRADSNIEGYGYPAYPEGIMSADPTWKHQNPKAKVATTTPAKTTTKKAASTPVIRNTSATFRVATNNIMSLPKNPAVLATLKTAPLASVMFVQEADLPAFKTALKRLGAHRITASIPKANTYSTFVMFDPAIWTHVSTRFVLAYKGHSGISLNRHIAVTTLKNKALGVDIAFISYHAVTAGNDKERKRMRKAGDKAVRTEVAKLQKLGTPVVMGADLNRTSNPFKRAKAHVSHRIDHIHAWNGTGLKVKINRHHTVATRSDHDVLVASITYSK